MIRFIEGFADTWKKKQKKFCLSVLQSIIFSL